MIRQVRQKISALLQYLEANQDRLILDGDTHPSDLERLHPTLKKELDSTPNYYHGRPIGIADLITEMNMAGIDLSLSWQNPATTLYDKDQSLNFERLMQQNRFIFECSEKYPLRIIPAGWTDPKACGMELAKKIVTHCIQDFGFLVVKMNPGQNAYPIDSPEVLEIVDHIISLKGIPAFHYGGDTQYTPPEGLEILAKYCKDHPLIAVHMGGGGSHFVHGESTYIKTRELGLKYPNLFFVLSAKRDSHIESDLITYQLAGEPFSQNIACGSDAPYGRQSWNYGGFRAMFNSLMDHKRHPDPRVKKHPGLFDEEVVQGYMGKNLSRLIIKGYQNMLQP